VVEAFHKAEATTQAAHCDALFAQGTSHFARCPARSSVRCRDLGNATEGTWHVQGKPLRGDWWSGDWWTLPLHLETYREALARVYPSQYVHICVFDRIYILGEDVLDYVRSQIPTEANLVTRAREGITASVTLYEYRILIPAAHNRRHLMNNLVTNDVVYDATNIPSMVRVQPSSNFFVHNAFIATICQRDMEEDVSINQVTIY